LHIALLRHGPTDWNEQGRIQGRTDTALSVVGRAKMAALAPPQGFSDVRAFTSPLRRARETALLLGYGNAVSDERLCEHHWGDWEGMTREEILAQDGSDAFARAGTGMAFTPKNGESTRDLLERVTNFFGDMARHETDCVAITHRGILRSAYALATGWDMLTTMPKALDLSGALILELDRNGRPSIAQLNAPLSPKKV